MSPTEQFLHASNAAIETVRSQTDLIATAADRFAETILAGRLVHVFGSGHSRMMVEEMWPRYGSFTGFNPIVELSLSFHNLVIGANGQRQAMFIENVSGLAEQILRNYDLSGEDSALVISSSGTNVVPVEMAELFQRADVRVVAIHSAQHSAASEPKREDGRKLKDFAEVVLDTGAPKGDSVVEITGLAEKVAPLSTIGGALLINTIKAEIAQRLTDAGQPPRVLTAACVAGKARATELFQSAYDEHGRRLAKLYQSLGLE